MVSRRFEKAVHRQHSKCGFPPELPSVEHDPFANEQKGNGHTARLRFGKWPDANEITVPLGKLAVVSLMFLDKGVVTKPDRRKQCECKDTGHGGGDSLLAPLRRLSGAQAVSFKFALLLFFFMLFQALFQRDARIQKFSLQRIEFHFVALAPFLCL